MKIAGGAPRILAIYAICGLLFSASAKAELRKDIEYGKTDGVSLLLDAYVPDGAGPFPAVIIVHGGAFTKGDKTTYVKPIFEPLTRANFAWFTINYRLAPQYKFPAAVDDVDRAIEFVRSHASEYKTDPKRLALLGESAGGYLVDYVGTQAEPKWRVAAVVSFYGPHDMERQAHKHVERGESLGSIVDFFGVPELTREGLARLRDLSPINRLRKGMPPFLLLHGTNDPQVEYQQSVKMCEKMKKTGITCELYTIEGAGHGMGGWEKTPAYKEKVVEWLKAELAGRRAAMSADQ